MKNNSNWDSPQYPNYTSYTIRNGRLIEETLYNEIIDLKNQVEWISGRNTII